MHLRHRVRPEEYCQCRLGSNGHHCWLLLTGWEEYSFGPFIIVDWGLLLRGSTTINAPNATLALSILICRLSSSRRSSSFTLESQVDLAMFNIFCTHRPMYKYKCVLDDVDNLAIVGCFSLAKFF